VRKEHVREGDRPRESDLVQDRGKGRGRLEPRFGGKIPRVMTRQWGGLSTRRKSSEGGGGGVGISEPDPIREGTKEQLPDKPKRS